VKRALDIAVSVACLLVLSPVLLLLGALVALDSPGPILYPAPRIGLGGRPFKMLKFRTMVANADQLGPAVTFDRDPRITRVGAILRAARLDELPQLINVLRGEMSLVGPRPEAPEYVAHYATEQRKVLQVRPGVTGLAQLTFRHEEALLSSDSPDEDYVNIILPQKLGIDMAYVERQSLWLDIRILVSTVLVMVADRLGLPSRALTVEPDLTAVR
jgi:lipopolysaccharide/colanic/teichoic acid biosynthesis glycosyltransferase